jgi:hypothetical protein
MMVDVLAMRKSFGALAVEKGTESRYKVADPVVAKHVQRLLRIIKTNLEPVFCATTAKPSLH